MRSPNSTEWDRKLGSMLNVWEFSFQIVYFQSYGLRLGWQLNKKALVNAVSVLDSQRKRVWLHESH